MATKQHRFFSRHALQCVAEAANIISSSLHHHHSIPALARKVGLNSNSLQASFKQVYGKSIFVFGQHLRLEHSQQLLRETDDSIQAVAEACGYPEQSNFSVAFKNKYVVPPGLWRRMEYARQWDTNESRKMLPRPDGVMEKSRSTEKIRD